LHSQHFSSSREGNNALYLVPMAQGKLKVKSKVPDSVAKKKKQQNSIKNSKVGKVVKGKKTRNCLKTPKGQSNQLTAKFRKDLGRKINSKIEAELVGQCQRVEEGKSFLTLQKEVGKEVPKVGKR